MLVCVGVLAAPAPALAEGWVYVNANNGARGQNSVLALRYTDTGRTSPAEIREFPTRGTGAGYIRGQSVGALAGDNQVALSRDREYLFAVNQRSNTIAVFRVNTETGTLRAVRGSPFPSGGRAPIALSHNGRYLVVANHGVSPPFAPGPGADFGAPNFTSFRVNDRTGRLRRVSTVPALPGPTQAFFAPNGRNLFSTSFYGFAGPANQTIQSLTLSRRGRLTEAPGSPTGFPESMTTNIPPPPPFLPPGIEKLAFGIAVHPSRPYAYILGTVNSRVGIYRYSSSGALTFTGQEDNPMTLGQCWAVVTRDGRFLFTANTVTQDISTFRISRGGGDLTFVSKKKLPSTATVFNLALDRDDRFLYAIGGHEDPDGPRPQEVNPDGSIGPPQPADGNFVESFRISRTGRLVSISTTPLPVRSRQLPYGIATLEKPERRRR